LGLLDYALEACVVMSVGVLMRRLLCRRRIAFPYEQHEEYEECAECEECEVLNREGYVEGLRRAT